MVDPSRGAFDPLINLQTAPLGFLVPVRGVVSIAGHGEMALRFLPFVASLATVAVVWLVGRRLAGRPLAGYAAALAAVSPLLIRYSDELKPYASDAFLAACAIWLALWAAGDLEWKRWVRVIAAGCVIVLAAVPGIFLAAAIALAVLLAKDGPPFAARARLAAVAMAVWGGLFTILYYLYYDPNQVALLSVHLPFVGLGREFLLSVRAFLAAVLVGPEAEVAMPRGTVGVLALLAAAGGVVTIFRHPRHAAAVLGPLAALAVAYLLGRWPLTPRVLLWCLPSVVLAAAVALDGLRDRLPASLSPALRAAVPLLLLVPAAYQATATAVDPPRREDTAAALAFLRDAASLREGAAPEPLYLAAHAEPVCRYYSPGVPERWACEIEGYRIVLGDWMPLPMAPGTLRAWAAREADLAAAELGDGGWLLLAGSDAARGALSARIEEEGLGATERQEFAGAEVLRVVRRPEP